MSKWIGVQCRGREARRFDRIFRHMQNSSNRGSSAFSEQPAAVGRPVGVMLIAVLCLVGAFIVALNLVLIVGEPNGIATLFGAERWTLLASLLLLPLLIAGGIGLLRLREWARLIVVGLVGVAILSFFVDSLLRYPVSTGLLLALSRSLIPATMLLYLLHPSIRPAFRRLRSV